MNTLKNTYSSTDKILERQKLEEEFEKNAILMLNQQKLAKIDSFTGYYDFLSNNFLTPVYYEGILFPSITHAFQAARSTDDNTKKAILNAESFQIIGKIARRIEDPEDWNLKRLKIMEQLVRDKFRRSKELQEKLKSTNPRELIMSYEDECPGNLFWGSVRGKGQNQLGRILMKIRKDILENTELINWITNCFEFITDTSYLPEINLSVNKDTSNIDHIILKNKPFYLFGSLPSNDVKLEHPSISRIHAAIICDKNNGIILIDLRSKSGTKIDGDLLKDHIPYRLKTGKKINFAMSTRDYIVDIDVSKIEKLYLKEKSKLENDYDLINKLDEKNTQNIDKDVLKKSFGLEKETNDNIFVNHIPSDAADEHIKILFEEQFGKIKNFRCPVERETGYKKGFAFIQFYNIEDAAAAVNYGIISFREKENIFLKIKYADPQPEWESYSNRDKEKESYYRDRRRSRSRSRSRQNNYRERKYRERSRSRDRYREKDRHYKDSEKDKIKRNIEKKLEKYEKRDQTINNNKANQNDETLADNFDPEKTPKIMNENIIYPVINTTANTETVLLNKENTNNNINHINNKDGNKNNSNIKNNLEREEYKKDKYKDKYTKNKTEKKDDPNKNKNSYRKKRRRSVSSEDSDNSSSSSYYSSSSSSSSSSNSSSSRSDNSSESEADNNNASSDSDSSESLSKKQKKKYSDKKSRKHKQSRSRSRPDRRSDMRK